MIMKSPRLLLAIAATSTAYAGPQAPAASIEVPSDDRWVTPTLDIRARYEYGDSDVQRASDSFTVRERVGLITDTWHGFSAFVEGEFTQALVDNYDGAPGGTTEPNNPTQIIIGDPENNELNRAWIKWAGYDNEVKLGRQRLVLDNAAFVGNVIWRQNEQTYDGVSLVNTALPDLNLLYAYFSRANRIFGRDGVGPVRAFTGDIHLFHAAYTGVKNMKLTGYAYLMDFDEITANNGYISNNTYGILAENKFGPFALRSELAYQTEADSSPAFVDGSTYAHFTGSYTTGAHTFSLGWEYLDADLVTPLSTVHAFNGFADVFINQRVGLVNNPGINDLHVSHAWKTPLWGINCITTFHVFGDNDTAFNSGWEIDNVLTKKFSENLLALSKLGFYKANNYAADTTRYTIELNYTF